MIKQPEYINIREVLSRVLRHPMLKSVDLEQAIQYTIDFISIVGMPTFYSDKVEVIDINKYRGVLPCDLVSIIQVRDDKTKQCLRSANDTFITSNKPTPSNEFTFNTQGRIIFTSFEKGKIEVSYKSIPVDKDGLPLLLDNSNFLKALELYIKKQVFTILFDLGKIQGPIIQNVQQEYAWAVAQCEKEFIMPNYSEMESILRDWTSLLDFNKFDNSYTNLGDRQTLNNI